MKIGHTVYCSGRHLQPPEWVGFLDILFRLSKEYSPSKFQPCGSRVIFYHPNDPLAVVWHTLATAQMGWLFGYTFFRLSKEYSLKISALWEQGYF